MNLTDTFYVSLCMTILILGVVYWFWTQNQYIQRKLNLLENIVFEIKTQIQKDGDSPPMLSPNMVIEQPESGSGSKYPPAPSSEVDDDEDLLNEEIDFDEMIVGGAGAGAGADAGAGSSGTSSPTLKITAADESQQHVPGFDIAPVVEDDRADDADLAAALQPGGVGSGIKEVPEPDSSAKGSVLEGMTLKELQRLAEQKGINTTRLRKSQLIDAIRSHSRPSPFQTTETTLELS